jgi:hypothetical protein
MDWFRMQNGVSQDPRLAVVARRSGLSRAEVLALWLTLYDHASRNRPRGSLDGLGADEMATLLDADLQKISIALDAFYDRGMITTGNHLAEWARVQRLSTERVRASRARRRPSDVPLLDAPPSTITEGETT